MPNPDMSGGSFDEDVQELLVLACRTLEPQRQEEILSCVFQRVKRAARRFPRAAFPPPGRNCQIWRRYTIMLGVMARTATPSHRQSPNGNSGSTKNPIAKRAAVAPAVDIAPPIPASSHRAGCASSHRYNCHFLSCRPPPLGSMRWQHSMADIMRGNQAVKES